MKKYLSIPLTTKITLIAASIFLVFATILSVQYKVISNKLEQNIKANQLIFAQQLSEALGTQFYERYGDVQAFALNIAFQKKSKTELVQVLNEYVSLYSIYDLILVSDINGDVIAVNSLDAKGIAVPQIHEIQKMNIKNENWFQKAITGQFTTDKNKGFDGTVFKDFNLDLISSKAFAKNMWGTVFTAPIKDSNGKTVGIISNHANSMWIEKEFENVFQSMKQMGYDSAEITLLDKSGNLLTELIVENSKQNIIIQHDVNKNLKRNFIVEGWEPLKNALIGKIDSIYFTNPITKVDHILSYSPVQSSKFISSIGWIITVKSQAKDALLIVTDGQFKFYSTVLLGIIMCLSIFYFFTKSIGKVLLDISSKISNSINETSTIGNKLELDSTELTSSSYEQAAAIQESVSSLSEISSMISQTSQNVKLSMEKAKSVTEKTIEGQKLMTRLSNSMSSIHKSSLELQNISRIIDEISAKTNVVNDIVFKTQLLSFNASIEAARAGQHGRGFAVVAEEVGNLAEMSGLAAGEIEVLLQHSQASVKETLEIIKHKINDGNIVNQQAVNFFDEISLEISEILNQVQSINEATQQQELGIQQTNSAMKQLDNSSQNNNQVAQTTSQNANQIKKQTEYLEVAKSLLLNFIRGDKNKFKNTFNSSIETQDFIFKKPEVKIEKLNEIAEQIIKKQNLDPDEEYFKKVI